MPPPLSSLCGHQSASCRRACNVAVGSHGQYVSQSPLQLPDALTPRWVKGPGDLDLCRVTCDVGYLCVNFSLPRPLCPRFRPEVRDRQDVRQHHRLMPLPIRGWRHNKDTETVKWWWWCSRITQCWQNLKYHARQIVFIVNCTLQQWRGNSNRLQYSQQMWSWQAAAED